MQTTSEYYILTQWLLINNNLLSSFLNFAIISDQKHQGFIFRYFMFPHSFDLSPEI